MTKDKEADHLVHHFLGHQIVNLSVYIFKNQHIQQLSKYKIERTTPLKISNPQIKIPNHQ